MSDRVNYRSELLFNRLSKRKKHLSKWAKRTGTNAFRLYDRDIPEIPLVLDFYEDSVSGALFNRNGEEEISEKTSLIRNYTAAVSAALKIDQSHIFIKERRRMRQRHIDAKQYQKISGTGFTRNVYEGEMKFIVNLSDYLDTGLFLDSRKKRAMIKSEAGEKRVLNLFAYTCSLSIAAALGGASAVDSVDLSNTYLNWGKANFELNDLETGELSGGKPFSFIREDVMEFITKAIKTKEKWDIIILDPPSFSNSKKMRGSLDIKRDYIDLIHRSLTLLNKGGKLWFSSNARRINFMEEDYPGCRITNMQKILIDEDFIGKRTPICYIIEK